MKEEPTVESGDPIYDEDGTELGVVTGSTASGLTISIKDEIEYVGSSIEAEDDSTDVDEESREVDPEEDDPGPEFGEGYIMWRCANCGEMGELEESFPDDCPNCGSDEVNKWKED